MAEAQTMQRRRQQDWWDKIWKDKTGKVVIYQHPNIPLIIWLVLTVLSIFVNGTLSNLVWWAAMAVLGLWAILEIWKGVNYFRRALGAVVLVMVVLALFRVGY